MISLTHRDHICLKLKQAGPADDKARVEQGKLQRHEVFEVPICFLQHG